MAYSPMVEARRWWERSQQYQSRFSHGRNALYRMCEGTTHDDLPSTISKLWLIGRSHAATLERTHRPSGTDVYLDTARRMAARGHLDSLLAKVPDSVESYSLDDLTAIHDAVSYLAGIFAITSKQFKLSLATKYLHFHRPTIPILDRYSEWTLFTLVPRVKSLQADGTLKGSRYGKHLLRFSWLFREMREHDYPVSARAIDNFLLYWYWP
jgi:hypothetical protein